LSRSARERRAREIIAESGTDTEEYFNKAVKHDGGITFREQAASWFEQVKTRKRKPVAVSAAPAELSFEIRSPFALYSYWVPAVAIKRPSAS
jgi:hypothetical protein